MALSYSTVKAVLDQASAATGGKFKPFDVNYYLSKNPDVANSYSGDPLQHYVESGAAEGRAPSAWFDAAFYRTAYSDVNVLSGAELLVHYAKFGAAEGRAPSKAFQNFDGARYLTDNPDVATYVNANLSQFNGSVTNGAIAHYVEYGALEGRKVYSTTGETIVGAVAPSSLNLTPTVSGSSDAHNRAVAGAEYNPFIADIRRGDAQFLQCVFRAALRKGHGLGRLLYGQTHRSGRCTKKQQRCHDRNRNRADDQNGHQ
jgi:hypothetical protein